VAGTTQSRQATQGKFWRLSGDWGKTAAAAEGPWTLTPASRGSHNHGSKQGKARWSMEMVLTSTSSG